MKERQWHFGDYTLLLPVRMSSVCGYGGCRKDLAEKRIRPRLRGRCQHCMNKIPGLSLRMKNYGFWFKRKEG